MDGLNSLRFSWMYRKDRFVLGNVIYIFFNYIYRWALMYLCANWLTSGESKLLRMCFRILSTCSSTHGLSCSVEPPSSASNDSSHALVFIFCCFFPSHSLVYQTKWNISLITQDRGRRNKFVVNCFTTLTVAKLQSVEWKRVKRRDVGLIEVLA